MKIYSTYCSAKKDESPIALPSIDRYISARILQVSSLAKSDKHPFFIFSGQYGLLKPDDQIPYYDHLLIEDEVSEHSHLVSQQIEENGITKIEFHTSSVLEDPNLKPYLECLRLACKETGIGLKIVVGEFTSE